MEILNNTNLICCFITFILGAMFMLATLAITSMNKIKEPRNNVHFYVAKHPGLYGLRLYLGKPTLDENSLLWIEDKGVKLLATNFTFEHYNLNPNDFKHLKLGEIMEVFINFED